ncbi:transposase [Streptomyces sp. NPDC056452]|uniref:transposase n=1 Tax=Streptomyces sp. NPDC056452 TaxID=3345821 RepID=UPI0036BC7646
MTATASRPRHGQGYCGTAPAFTGGCEPGFGSRRRRARLLACTARAFPDTRHQWCWAHKTANVLDALPKSAQPAAKRAVQEIYNAEDEEHEVKAVATFAKTVRGEVPQGHQVDHRRQGRTPGALSILPLSIGPICGPRTPSSRPSPLLGCEPRSPKAPGSRAAALSMVFKLIESAQARWRPVNAPHLVVLVRAGAHFERDQLVERPEGIAA